MRASVDTSLLIAALSDIGSVAGRDAEIIQCVRISAKDNSLRLITTNIDMEAHAIVEAATSEDGHVSVNARDLAFSLKGVSGWVELRASPEGLSISCATAQVTLPVRYEEFPRLPAPKDMMEIIGGVDALEHSSDRRVKILTKVMGRVEIDEETGCWLWQGPTSGNGRGGGYGRMCLDGQTVAVHRVMATLFMGYIPGKKQVDHVCRNRLCVNPDHLEIVTHKENQRRRDAERSEVVGGPWS